MAFPAYVNKGTFTSGTGALTVPVPTGYAAGQLFILFVETANQFVNTPSGWTTVANQGSQVGTAATAGGVRLNAYYKFATASESSVAVDDSGDHTTAIIMSFSGVNATTPFDITASSSAAANSNLFFPTVTTTVAECLIVGAAAFDTDAASTAVSSGYTNAALASIIERHDQTVADGFGGGLVVFTGTKATAGAVGVTSATGSTSVTHAYLTMALKPVVATGVTLDVTLLGKSTLTATLQVGVKLAEDFTSTSTLTANLQVGAAFAAQLTGISSLTGALQVGAAFAEDFNARATLGGALQVGVTLAEAFGAVATLAGNLQVGATLAEAFGAVSTLTGALQVGTLLAAPLPRAEHPSSA